MKSKYLLLLGIVLCSLFTTVDPLFAQGTAFTYQGRLNDGANLAAGIYDVRFAIHDAVSAGNQIAGPFTNSTTAVSNGLFTVTLDFGAGVFTGTNRWLEIAVRTNGGGAFTNLAPRQKITAAPYAITAGNLTGTLAASQLSGAIANVNLPASPIFSGTATASSFSGNGAGLTNLAATNLTGTIAEARLSTNVTLLNANQNFTGSNNFTGTLVATNGSSRFAGNGGGLTNISAATLGGLASSNFWQTGGNTISPAQFLGSTNFQALELRVANVRALRLEPTINDVNHSNMVNVINGSPVNAVAPGVYGATIAGGGAANYFGSSYTNRVESDFGTVSGGSQNKIQSNGESATIGGGVQNTIQPNVFYGTISGGVQNTVQNDANGTTIGGGRVNTIQNGSESATISGGYGNTIQPAAFYATIGGGNENLIQFGTYAATISGGDQNTIQTNGDWSAIGGGVGNTIQVNAQFATIPGGRGNNAAGDYSFAAGHRARANHTGTFVWADSTDADFASSGSDQFLVRAAGGVGIGLSNPGFPLHIGSTLGVGAINGAGQRVVIENATANGRAALLLLAGPAVSGNATNRVEVQLEASDSERRGIIGTASDHEVQFRQHNAVRMTLSTSGHVGIGTGIPSRELEVQATGDTEIGIKSTDANSHLWTLQSSGLTGNSVVDASFQIIDRTISSSRFFIATNGNVGIGTTGPTARLSVNGTANNTTGAWGIFSDRRLKKNIEPMRPGSLDQLLKLESVTYDYVRPEMAEGYDGLRRGWIAQQVQEVFPEWISEAPDGMKMVTPVGFNALTVEALRELRAEKDSAIQKLNQKVEETLKEKDARITALETELIRLKQMVETIANRND